MRGSVRAALTHPLALLLLSASLAIAVLLLLVPTLRPWSGRASLVVILGLVAYVTVIVIVYWSGPEPRPELRTLLKIRNGIAGLRATGPGRAILQETISDAVRILDEQLIPTMRELLGRQRSLDEELTRYRSGDLPAPASDHLARLREIHRRRAEAIDACLQQAVNARATLVALLQAGDEGNIGQRARAWANDLLLLHDTLSDVLRSAEDDPTGAAPAPAPPPAAAAPAPSPTAEPARQSPNGTAPVSDATVPSGQVDAASPTEDLKTPNGHATGLRPLIEEALKSLNDWSKLSECKLAERLPYTFHMMRRKLSLPDEHSLTSREKAHLIRQVTVDAVERLKPEGEATVGDNPTTHHYLVMKHLYTDRMAYKQVALRLGISQETVHRRRREAVLMLDGDLAEQEARLSRDLAR